MGQTKFVLLGIQRETTMLTKQDVLELFAKTDKQIAETNKGIAELRESQKKTDAQLAKTDAQLAKTDAQLARTEKTIDRLAAKMDKMNEMYGGLSNNVGEATEQLFFNILNDEPVLNGIRFDDVQRNWHDRVGKCQDEYDIVMRNGSSIFILESKFKATKSDVEKLLTTKQENFNILFPKYKDYDQHWGLAATIIDKKLKDMAVENGLTVLQYKGGLLVTPPSNARVIVCS